MNSNTSSNTRRKPLRLTLLSAALLATTSPLFGQDEPEAAANPHTITVKDFLGRDRIINDFDGDGWDDLWCAMYRDLEHRNRNTDTDGDGLTDYEEMVMWRDPFVEGPLPREITDAEREIAEEEAKNRLAAAQTRWDARIAAMRDQLCEQIPLGQGASDRKLQEAADENAELRRKAAVSHAGRPQRERDLDAIARKHGVAREVFKEDGSKKQLVGELGGVPLFIESFDTLQSASISADELWPLAAWPNSENNSGLGLTGSGVALGLWEVDGGMNIPHLELGSSRFFQKDVNPAPLDVTGHATQVAGTLGGSGAVDLFFLPAAFNESRGVAYQATVFGYDTEDLDEERTNAAAGVGTDPPLRIGNNSWGIGGPWELFDNDPNPPDLPGEDTDGDGEVGEDNIDLQWRWTSVSNPAFQEDPRFGFYFPDLDAESGGTQVDTFMHTDAKRCLLIYACGNDRGTGPGTAPPTYFIGANEIDSAVGPRDWENGDEGGFDTVASPATAKNVLTIGSCEDVYHIVGAQVNAGFGPNAVVVPSAFSGAGPTDDGRIKPDLVATGSPSAFAREEFALEFTPAGGSPIGVIVAPNDDANDNYALGLQGTSFAAPTVAGALGLVMERRADLYPALPEAEDYLGSTLKAIAINSCDDVGAEGPDYRLGYGVMNAQRAVQAVDDDFDIGRGSLIKELTLDPAESLSWVVQSDGADSLLVTLAWSDPEGPAPTVFTTPEAEDPMLVNNLDLVVDYLGLDITTFPPADTPVSEFLPWVLTPDLSDETAAARSMPAFRDVDNRNNVEKVSITSPAAGRYRITVTHAGGVGNNPNPSQQAASVVLSGVVPESPRLTKVESSPTANEFLLTFEADPGAYFTVQSSETLEGGTWADVVSVLADNTVNTLTVTAPAAQDKGFWRLRRGL